MKKLCSAGLALVLASAFVPAPAQATITATECADLAGVGTSADPYLVANQADLMAVSICDAESAGNAFFKQVADIELEGDWVPLERLDGTYLGNSRSISGLNVQTPNNYGAGLFSLIRGGSVENLTVVANSLKGQSYAGIIAADASDFTLENVRVLATGTLDANNGAGCLVGIAGGDVTLKNVVADCNTASRVRWVGGLVGYLGAFSWPVHKLVIEKAYIRGNFDFSEMGGGIAGFFRPFEDDAEISEVHFAGDLNAPASQSAAIGGLFGWVENAVYDGQRNLEATVAPVINITNTSVRGSLNSDLVTEIQEITFTPSMLLASLFSASGVFSAATVVDFYTTPFRVSPTVGRLGQTGVKGSTTPRLVLSKMLLAPEYSTPENSDGYRVNVGLLPVTGSPAPSCVFYIAPAVASFSYERVTSLTLINPTQARAAATFDGCLQVADGAAAVSPSSTWLSDPDLFGGLVGGAQFVNFGLHESTLDYGQESFEIAHDEIFSALNSSSNFFPEFTISPALPTGISLEANTGRITGSATQAFGPTSYTITRTSLFSFPTQTTSITLSQLNPDGSRAGAAVSGGDSYQGPLIQALNPNPVQRGSTLTMSGQQLSQVSQIAIGDSVISASEMTVTDTQLSFVVPAAAPLGQQPLVLVGSFGSLSYQNGVEVLAETVRFEVRRQANGDLKLYAFGILNQGKIQFMVDGQELAWVRATTNQNAGVRTIVTTSGSEHYLVRTLKNPNSKSIQFHHDSRLVKSHN